MQSLWNDVSFLVYILIFGAIMMGICYIFAKTQKDIEEETPKRRKTDETPKRRQEDHIQRKNDYPRRRKEDIVGVKYGRRKDDKFRREGDYNIREEDDRWGLMSQQ